MSESDAAARRQAFAAASPVTEEMIEALVHAFYAKVRADAVLGPLFNRVIPDEAWPAHLAKLCDFWSAVTLMSGRFKGSPMQAHMKIDELNGDHFIRWLALFEETAREVCPPDAADIFAEKSQMIARSLQMGMHLARGNLKAAVAT